jgi:hypothetical protein
MTITKEVFEQRYARQSSLTLEELRNVGQMAVPCSCGKHSCPGWRMANVMGMSDGEIDALPAPYDDEARRLKLQVLGRED